MASMYKEESMSEQVVDVTFKIHFPEDMEWDKIVAELDEAEWSFLAESQTQVEVHDYWLEPRHHHARHVLQGVSRRLRASGAIKTTTIDQTKREIK